MPIYEYECSCGNRFERTCKIVDHKSVVTCECGKKAKQVITGRSLVLDEDVHWLESARRVLQPDGERPVTSRTEWKKYLKENHLACIG